MVTTRQGVVLGTQPTQIETSAGTVMIVPQAAGTIILGGSSAVTSANGCRLPVTAGQPITVALNLGEELWALVASGSLTVDLLAEGN